MPPLSADLRRMSQEQLERLYDLLSSHPDKADRLRQVRDELQRRDEPEFPTYYDYAGRERGEF